MNTMKALLELRKKLKSKKPTFIRHDAHKKKRVSLVWRRPKGRQNKMRLSRKGYAKRRSTGYGSPKEVEGLSREGFKQNLVHNINDFKSLDSKIDGVIIARTIGLRKKQEMLEFALTNGFTILNLKKENVDKAVAEKLAAKKQKKKQIDKRKETKSKALASSEKKSKEKEDKKSEDKKSEEEKKVEEKKEHDKILAKGDGQ